MSSDYFDAFVREGQEQITELNNSLLALEDDPDDTETMDDIFRSAHTLKGNFAAMGYDDAGELAHALEDMLDEMREGNMSVTSERMDLIFEGVDELEAILDEIEESGDNSIDPAALVEELRDAIDTDDAGNGAGTEPSNSSGGGAPTDGSFDATDTAGVLSVVEDTASLAAYDGDVHHARVRVEDRGMKGADGMMALQGVSRFDLIAAHPPEGDIEDGDYEGTFDLFVGGGDADAVESGLSGQQSVEEIRIREATADVADLDAPAVEGDDGPGSDEGPATGGDSLDAGSGDSTDTDGATFGEDPANADDYLEDAGGSTADDPASASGVDDGVATKPQRGATDPDSPVETSAETTGSEAVTADADPSTGQTRTVTPDQTATSGPAVEGTTETTAESGAGTTTHDDEDRATTSPRTGGEAQAAAAKTTGGGTVEASASTQQDRRRNQPKGDPGGTAGPLTRVRLAIGGVFATVAAAFGVTGNGSTNGTHDSATSSDDGRVAAGDGTRRDAATADASASPSSPTGEGKTVGASGVGGSTTPDGRDDTAATTDGATEAAAEPSTAEGESAAATTTTGVGAESEGGDHSVDTGTAASGSANGEPAADESGETVTDGNGGGSDVDIPDDFTTGPNAPDIDPSEVDAEATTGSGGSTETASASSSITEEADDDDWGWDDEDTGEDDDDGSGSFDSGSDGDEPGGDSGGGGGGDGGDGSDGDDPGDRDDDDITSTIDDIKSVRVDVDQLDDLYGLVEQLVTSRIKLRKALEDAEIDVEKDLDELDKTTSSLQDTVMDMRLVPMKKIVGKFPRVVRDLSREQGKEVDFTMEGTDVELDRTILDRLSDPLIHILRNAVDHGIEPPAEREAKGKPRQGSITLTAHRERDRAIIEVEDDGGGLDAEEIRQKAFEEGIRSSDELEQMDDDSVYDLVFHPGFSTTDEVTDVSGRGVGMDVVHNTVTRLDGSVNVDSEPNEGTTVTLELPVSIAIVKVLFVEVGDHQFGVPIKKIDKVSRFDGAETVNGKQMIKRDDELFKMIRLHEALDTVIDSRDGDDHEDGAEDDDGMLIRVRRDERPVALYCDAVSDQEEVVVKPLEGVLSGTPGLSGTAVLGEGNVVPVLDVKTI